MEMAYPSRLCLLRLSTIPVPHVENLLRTPFLEKLDMDYIKTRQLYQEIGKIKAFEETADFNRYTKEQRWYENVKSKRSGEYYRAEDLMKRELVSKKWTPPHVDDKTGEPLKYPLKYVTSIYRVRIADMSEWLMSTQEF
jgi:hypothetical protein